MHPVKILLLLLTLLVNEKSFSQKLYQATGKASFYAKKFEGRNTASGEKFSNQKFTAAHRTLPFGTLVKVTNLSNNKSVIVKINDRGPFVRGRIIDLSRIAADSLDFIPSGFTTVNVEEIPPPDTTGLAAKPVTLPDSSLFQFPDDWLGKWNGELKVYSSQGLVQVVPMALNIANTDSADRIAWEISYGDEPRHYQIVIRDTAARFFSLDEGNGIDLYSRLLGNTLLTRFAVNGQLQDCEFTLRSRNVLEMELHDSDDKPRFGSGYAIMNGDSLPQVKVFDMQSLQRASLHRSDE